jgi:hypothetical protein
MSIDLTLQRALVLGMAMICRLFMAMAVCAGVLASAGPAAASHPTCDDLLAALDSGQTVADVAVAFSTTRARVEACTNVARQRERLAEKRVHFDQQRAQRGLAH